MMVAVRDVQLSATPVLATLGDRPGVVLLVEDDDADALLVTELLRDEGAAENLRRARNMQEALDELGPDIACVLLDLNLPDASGLEVLRRTLAAAEEAAVIVLTGMTDRAVGIAAVAEGAQDYLVKGEVDGALLARAIRYAVERRVAARRLAQAQIDREHNARIERGLLPRLLVDDRTIEWGMRYLPGGGTSELGGDFLDAVQRRDGSVRAVIGDVCGHGPDQAALGASLRIAWRALVLAGLPDPDILELLERVLVAERTDPFEFVTVCDVTIAPGFTAISSRLAGHPMPLTRAGRPAIGEEHRGPPLGIGEEVGWETLTAPLAPEGGILLYTDGLIEGRTPGRRLLGIDGLQELVAEGAAVADPDVFLEGLIGEVHARNGGELSDDLACLVLAPART
ncbi:MAG: response regulator receiver modulated serine phosphatase [Solirubrobacteraceae bacterium]|nr:response regulator receiver modulated serine phosphatase [Solirubrobacteraceae bacterium]